MRIAIPHLAWIALLACTAGCNGAPTATVTASTQTAVETGTQTARVGDTSILASVVQSTALPDSVARQYDIQRDPRTLVLLVAVRRGVAANEVSVPATVTAAVTDLSGARQSIGMQQVRADGFIDSVGTVHTTLPDTLRFELTVQADGLPATPLRFAREFYPQ